MSDPFFFSSPFRRLLLSPSAATDWLETPTAHIIRINVPGFGKDDVKVQLDDGNVLRVTGEAKEEKEGRDKDSVWHAAERGKGELWRELVLPENARAEQIKAQVENGVLTIVVPKEAPPARPKPRSIPVSSRL